jgi:hypothetical protein
MLRIIPNKQSNKLGGLKTTFKAIDIHQNLLKCSLTSDNVWNHAPLHTYLLFSVSFSLTSTRSLLDLYAIVNNQR